MELKKISEDHNLQQVLAEKELQLLKIQHSNELLNKEIQLLKLQNILEYTLRSRSSGSVYVTKRSKRVKQ
jgi:hypothetical protein